MFHPPDVELDTAVLPFLLPPLSFHAIPLRREPHHLNLWNVGKLVVARSCQRMLGPKYNTIASETRMIRLRHR